MDTFNDSTSRGRHLPLRFKVEIFISVLIFLCVYDRALALTYEGGGQLGLMMQPNSQYLHKSSGAFFGIANDQKSFIFRSSYLERQPFNSNGYSDGELGLFAHIGSKLTDAKYINLLSFWGFGKMSGYVKNMRTQKERKYSIDGVSAIIELKTMISKYSFSLALQNFIAFDGEHQIKYYVAWPFNNLYLRISFEI